MRPQSNELGRFTDLLGFEVVGGEKLVTVPVTGTCDYPHISSDPRNVFFRKASPHHPYGMRACTPTPPTSNAPGRRAPGRKKARRKPPRPSPKPCPHAQVKQRPPTPSISRQYVAARNMFEFGPLLLGKDPAGYAEGKHPDNTARLRITNNGLFPAQVRGPDAHVRRVVVGEKGTVRASTPARLQITNNGLFPAQVRPACFARCERCVSCGGASCELWRRPPKPAEPEPFLHANPCAA